MAARRKKHRKSHKGITCKRNRRGRVICRRKSNGRIVSNRKAPRRSRK